MATEAEIIASNVLASAIEYKRLYDTTKNNDYKVKEQRLRRIAENIKLLVGSSSSSSVNSFNGRTGAVVLTSADVTGALGYVPPTILDGLNDVTISAPANAQVLTYNSTTNQWENQTPSGGSGTVTGYGSFYSNVTQTLAAINTPQAVTLGSTYEAVGTSTSGSRIYMDKAGTYQFSYVAQVANDANSQEYAEFWIKYNGVEYPNSNTKMILQPRKGAGSPSEQIMTLIINGTSLNDNDYIELFWEATSTQVSLKYDPASGSYPATPSIIANIIPIGAQGRDSNLNELNDVIITSPTDGQVLTYDSATSKWVNENPTGGSLTLDQVTTAGNRTQNDIYVGTIGSETELSRMTQVIPGALYPNFTVSNYDTLVNGAVVYQNLSGGADVTPLVNNTTYYVKKIYGLPSPIGGTYANNQVELYSDAGLTSVIYLTANIVGNHYLYQANRNITNTLFANKNFQIEDGFLLINAKQYKTGDVHWISPKDNWVDGYIDDGDGGVLQNNNNLNRQTTLLVGPYTEYSTAPLTNANGTCIIHSNGQSSFIGIEWNGIKYGIGVVLPSQNANSATIGGYYTGLGIGSTQFSSNTDPSFGVLALNQSGNGRGSVNFTVYNNKRIHTFNNVLDNSSGFIGINVDPAELLHIRQASIIGDSIIRVDNDSANSQSIGGNVRFYRGGQGVITGSTLLGKIDYYGAITGTNMSNYTFVQSASFEVRAVSGAWSTTTNRSAQFLFFTRHQNTYAERMRLTSEGNLLINTTTNGTFRLDVNGTARIQNALTLGSLASDPAGTNGMIYYNTTTNKFRAYENGAWVNII